ncbi:uncharacterized protein LOC133185148 [Saccostrea echinata]|uniref:uncharacterized protein LOC133185148 n=1 Tax=Saccostrea echinata TaxID=191078 RepID=UPI002A7F79E7|nr:uncharacterized protein LOC133185148 [Saccostrea echinata]
MLEKAGNMSKLIHAFVCNGHRQQHREYSEPAKQHQTCRTGQVSEISEEDGSLSCSWNSFDSPEPSDSYIDEIIGENARHLRKGRKGHLNMLKVKQTAAHDGYPHDNSQKLEWKLKSDGGNQTLKPSSDGNKEMTEHICQYVVGIYLAC